MKLQQFNVENSELEKLIQDNFGLIISQALFLKPKNQEVRNDCIQAAVLAFIKCVDKFDPKRAMFSTYISSCIRNAILDYNTKHNKHTYKELKDTSIVQSEEFWELIPDNLLPIEKSIIMLKLQNYSKAEIADILDHSQDEVTKLFNSAKRKIREANSDDD